MDTDRPTRGVLLRVLGDVEAVGAAGTFAPGQSRPGAVLAMLAIHAGEAVPADRLVDEVWPSDSMRPGGKRLQVNVLRLRRGLASIAPDVDPARIVRTRTCGYSLEIDPDGVDAVRFARLIDGGRAALRAGDPRLAARTLSRALAMWRGEPYAGYAYEAFASAEVRRLDDLRALAAESHVEAHIALGAHEAMAVELQRHVARSPLCERSWALLMLALYRSHRQGDALAAFGRARTALLEGLGIEPGPQLRDLQRAILEQSPALHLPAWRSSLSRVSRPAIAA